MSVPPTRSRGRTVPRSAARQHLRQILGRRLSVSLVAFLLIGTALPVATLLRARPAAARAMASTSDIHYAMGHHGFTGADGSVSLTTAYDATGQERHSSNPAFTNFTVAGSLSLAGDTLRMHHGQPIHSALNRPIADANEREFAAGIVEASVLDPLWMTTRMTVLRDPLSGMAADFGRESLNQAVATALKIDVCNESFGWGQNVGRFLGAVGSLGPSMARGIGSFAPRAGTQLSRLGWLGRGTARSPHVVPSGTVLGPMRNVTLPRVMLPPARTVRPPDVTPANAAAIQVAAGLDYSSPLNGGALWNKGPAFAAAQAAGKMTLETTPGGRAVEAMTQGVPWVDSKGIWSTASQKYTSQLLGDVDIFVGPPGEWGFPSQDRAAALYGGLRRDSVVFTEELPMLWDNPKVTSVTFHHLPPVPPGP